MKIYAALALGLIVAAWGLFPTVAAAQFGNNAQNDRVCVYRDNNFNGQETCYRPGDEIADLGSQRQRISSIRIEGRARVTVYSDRNFSGLSRGFDSNVVDLAQVSMSGNQSWNDRVNSLVIAQDTRTGRSDRRDNNNNNGRLGNNGRWGGNDRQPQNGVCVYDEANYRGRSECWSAGDTAANLTSGLGDRISSVRVFGRARAVLYRDSNFRGPRIAIDRDIPDLGQLRSNGGNSWNDQTSSVEVEGARTRTSRF